MVYLPGDFRAALAGLVAANGVVIFIFEQILVQRITYCFTMLQKHLQVAEFKDQLKAL